jgi:4-azaleucine resistance transporter AzlC
MPDNDTEKTGAGRWRMAGAGLRDTLPVMASAVPFGVIFGTLAVARGFSLVETLAMSLFVFSGAAQFVAVGLVAAGAGLWVVWFATLILNLRHLLYAATLVPYVRHLSQAWRFPLAAMLTDETFAVVERRYREHGVTPLGHWYYFASCIGMYINWAVWTLVGATLGSVFPSMADWGLEFAMVATFLGIIVPGLRAPPFWGALVAAMLIAVAAHALPYNLGLLLASLAGITAGLLLERRTERGRRLEAARAGE